MVNYLTTKNRLLVAILAFILPFSFARAEVIEDGKTISQGWYVGIEGGICAPNVSAIDEGAFAECYELRKVTLGELSDVKGDCYVGDGIFGNDLHIAPKGYQV